MLLYPVDNSKSPNETPVDNYQKLENHRRKSGDHGEPKEKCRFFSTCRIFSTLYSRGD